MLGAFGGKIFVMGRDGREVEIPREVDGLTEGHSLNPDYPVIVQDDEGIGSTYDPVASDPDSSGSDRWGCLESSLSVLCMVLGTAVVLISVAMSPHVLDDRDASSRPVVKATSRSAPESPSGWTTDHYVGTLRRVVDGDTAEISVNLGLDVSRTIDVRMEGYDAPERSDPDGSEATARLRSYLDGRTLYLWNRGGVLSFARYVCRVYYFDDGTLVDVSDRMTADGFDVPHSHSRK